VDSVDSITLYLMRDGFRRQQGNKHGYDPPGQVISGKRSWLDATPVAGQQFEYTFTHIVASTYGPGQSATGAVFVARTPEAFSYDADGGLGRKRVGMVGPGTRWGCPVEQKKGGNHGVEGKILFREDPDDLLTFATARPSRRHPRQRRTHATKRICFALPRNPAPCPPLAGFLLAPPLDTL